jgi:type I restriction enzyme, R subunit
MCDSLNYVFNSEAEFEEALINYLTSECGWEQKVLKYPTEEDLIENWRQILSKNNLSIDVLNGQPLTETEMEQVLAQVKAKHSPFELNTFINGGSIGIKRDNPNDPLHLGKEVYLKIYDRLEIAGGKSRYQIAQQPQFKTSSVLPKRRGDIMLLINGMPVFHLELKNSASHLSEAYNQIEKYSHEGIFSGIFSLIQVFVAMTPNDCLYFANPGSDVKVFDKRFFFHWADVNNTPIKDWKSFSSELLRIPMAHQIIGFYTIADRSDGILKVLRSYQYYAINKIANKIARADWNTKNQRGGVVWHTTGSGKTITSYKAADLISRTKDADKIIFLVDRIDLDTQSRKNYVAFSSDDDYVQGVENTTKLINKLKDTDSHLIVASIQKMYRIKEDDATPSRAADIEKINKKRLVFIVDECHRDTFGDMMYGIKQTFPKAIFFGFSGTPIMEDNKKKDSTSADVFGEQLHSYVIGEAIRDKNVLGFDPYLIETFKSKDLCHQIALEKAKAKNLDEVMANSKKKAIYYKYMNDVSMIEIEDLIPNAQYETIEHEKAVVKDIKDRFRVVSMDKFHAIFATSSIAEAIKYYRLFKVEAPELKTTVIVDPSEDNGPDNYEKIQGLAEVVTDYNNTYFGNSKFSVSDYKLMKIDVLCRLAHKEQYRGIEKHKEKQLDLVIVVNQLLTGFDSKWINALYLDKVLYQENIIQAFSRTNRLCGDEKRFGLIFYYRRPYTMKRNIEKAIELYSGSKAPLVYVPKLCKNLEAINFHFNVIKDLFNNEGIENFSRLPKESATRAKFAQEFNELNSLIEMVKVQDFSWDKKEYTEGDKAVSVEITENDYVILLKRYKELYSKKRKNNDETHYDLDSHITEIETGKIDEDYLNSRFKKYLLVKRTSEDAEQIQKALAEVSNSFAFLSENEQKYAYMFIRDLQNGDITPDENKSFKEYIVEYMKKDQNDCIHKFAVTFGIDELDLREVIVRGAKYMNEFGKKDKLKEQAKASALAQEYFSKKEGKPISAFKANLKFEQFLTEFIEKGGFEI